NRATESIVIHQPRSECHLPVLSQEPPGWLAFVNCSLPVERFVQFSFASQFQVGHMRLEPPFIPHFHGPAVVAASSLRFPLARRRLAPEIHRHKCLSEVVEAL